MSGSNLFAGSNSAIFLSTNNGANWFTSFPGGSSCVTSFAVSDGNIFAGSWDGVLLSTDNGTSWTAVNSGLTRAVFSLAISGNNLFAGTNGGVYLSTNNGSSWNGINSGFTISNVNALAIKDTKLFAGPDYNGVFLSTNNGTSWSSFNNELSNYSIEALAVSGNNLFAGTYRRSIYLSTNDGNSWTRVSYDLIGSWVQSLIVSGNNLIAGTIGGGVWRRRLSEMITSVKQVSTQLPDRFVLYQNYPDPFNPTTTLSFCLPSKLHVSLKIFDLAGREVATIVNEELSSGNHTRQWNAANVSSGVYFYRLQAGSYSEAKKLILLR